MKMNEPAAALTDADVREVVTRLIDHVGMGAEDAAERRDLLIRLLGPTI